MCGLIFSLAFGFIEGTHRDMWRVWGQNVSVGNGAWRLPI